MIKFDLNNLKEWPLCFHSVIWVSIIPTVLKKNYQRYFVRCQVLSNWYFVRCQVLSNWYFVRCQVLSNWYFVRYQVLFWQFFSIMSHEFLFFICFPLDFVLLKSPKARLNSIAFHQKLNRFLHNHVNCTGFIFLCS